MEGGNEAQSQGEGVAEFRALQEQQRMLRKTYDDLRGAVMGTANVAARGRAQADAKLSDVLEGSRRVRAAYMKGSPMFESLLAEREKLKAELSRCSDKIAEIVRDAGDQNKEQTEYQREMRERTLALEEKIGEAQARVEKTMLEVRERSEQSLQLEASRQAQGTSANDATLQLRSQLATETARVRAARLEKAARTNAQDLSVLSVSAMHEAANETAAAEQIEAVVISPSSSEGNTTAHHAIAREIAILSSMKVRLFLDACAQAVRAGYVWSVAHDDARAPRRAGPRKRGPLARVRIPAAAVFRRRFGDPARYQLLGVEVVVGVLAVG